MKRQPSEWEKMIAYEATDKKLISKIYKQLEITKTNNPNKKYIYIYIRPKHTFIQTGHTDSQ